MPYRRLPKTDQARIRALKAAVDSSVVGECFFTSATVSVIFSISKWVLS